MEISKLTPATGNSQKRWALLGCSRGLGRAFLEILQAQSSDSAKLLVSRKVELLKPFQNRQTIVTQQDFAKKEEWPTLLAEIKKFAPTHVIYFAGGGPFGPFQTKSWKDHEWSLRVTFECPAFLLHSLLEEKSLQQITFVGSQIAEATTDPQAASYCAGKHALRGLVTTVIAENKEKDVRLFSPGYLDTDLLPANAWPRQQRRKDGSGSSLVESPKEAAEVLWNWLQSNGEADQHLRWPQSFKL